MPPPDPTPTGTWVAVADLANLLPGKGRQLSRGGEVYALFRLGDDVTALGGLCPHQQAPLADGVVDPVHRTITCPRRGCLRWRFALDSGRHAAGLAVACAAYPVEVRAGVVFARLPG